MDHLGLVEAVEGYGESIDGRLICDDLVSIEKPLLGGFSLSDFHQLLHEIFDVRFAPETVHPYQLVFDPLQKMLY